MCRAPWQVLVIYLQYNYIASKLPLNWPKTVLDFAGIVQIFFGNGEGIFSVDCLLQARAPNRPLSALVLALLGT